MLHDEKRFQQWVDDFLASLREASYNPDLTIPPPDIAAKAAAYALQLAKAWKDRGLDENELPTPLQAAEGLHLVYSEDTRLIAAWLHDFATELDTQSTQRLTLGNMPDPKQVARSWIAMRAEIADTQPEG